MVKIYTRFQTKTAQKPSKTLWGGTYLHSLYRGVPPPPPRERNSVSKHNSDVKVLLALWCKGVSIVSVVTDC